VLDALLELEALSFVPVFLPELLPLADFGRVEPLLECDALAFAPIIFSEVLELLECHLVLGPVVSEGELLPLLLLIVLPA
jgi:hypothetical protein